MLPSMSAFFISRNGGEDFLCYILCTARPSIQRRNDMSTTMAIANQKGGVGKTCTAHNLGVGLGLSLVWEIADLHGGCVWVEKSSDKGTTIAVELPAGAEAEPSGADIP